MIIDRDNLSDHDLDLLYESLLHRLNDDYLSDGELLHYLEKADTWDDAVESAVEEFKSFIKPHKEHVVNTLLLELISDQAEDNGETFEY